MAEERPNTLEEELLTLLVDGEESIASIAHSLLELEIQPDTPMDEIADSLDKLLRANLVQMGYWGDDSAVGEFPRLPNQDVLARERKRYHTVAGAAREEWPFIGLWYRLTPEGRAYWNTQVGAKRSAARQWMIEENRQKGTLVIHALSDDVAATAVDEWNRSNPSRMIAKPQQIERGVSFSMRDGTRVDAGVRWTFPQADH